MKQHSRALIAEKPINLLPKLACVLGVHEAIVLQQVQFWLQFSKHRHDGRLWIYNTYDQWSEQFPFWTIDGIRKIIYRLETSGILLTTDAYNDNRFNRRKWYSIDYDLLDQKLDAWEADHPGQCVLSEVVQRPTSSGDDEPGRVVSEATSTSAAEPALTWDDEPGHITENTQENTKNSPSLGATAEFPIPTDFTVTPAMKARVAPCGYSDAVLAKITRKFIADCESKGLRSFNWPAKWVKFVEMEGDWGAPKTQSRSRRDEPYEELDHDQYKDGNYLKVRGGRS